jgi:hypothetical protein
MYKGSKQTTETRNHLGRREKIRVPKEKIRISLEKSVVESGHHLAPISPEKSAARHNNYW